MDHLCHNCPRCHELTPMPSAHTCGRTPEGTLPAHQPHALFITDAELDAFLHEIHRED